MVLMHAGVFAVGLVLVISALFSALRTFVVPRGTRDFIIRTLFMTMRALFEVLSRRMRPAAREQALAFYAPVTLLTLPGLWLACLLLGYTAIYWSLGSDSWSSAFTSSRLSLLTLGSDPGNVPAAPLFTFSETVFSLLLAAILVSYLPTMYSAFSQREANVTGLETLAGSPPAPRTMLVRHQRIQGMERISEVWPQWQAWFEVVEESHTSLFPLIFYRSPQPERSWITAAGVVLDTAALVASTLERPRDPAAELCIRAGYLCLQRIARQIAIPHHPDPTSTHPITIRRAEFDTLCDELAEAGVSLKADRDQAWRDFAGWRVNYDAVLVALAVLTAAPPAPWSSDRVPHRRSRLGDPLKQAREVGAAIAAGRPLPD